jgi:hypothetical protein
MHTLTFKVYSPFRCSQDIIMNAQYYLNINEQYKKVKDTKGGCCFYTSK